MNLPNLIVPGAPKSGTSSFHMYLAQHRSVLMSTPKELHFFSIEENFETGVRAYSRHFSDWNGETVIGESSTTYFAFPNVVERIAVTLKDPKFIFLLRNPIDRAGSHFRWMKSLGLENKNFREALLEDMDCQPDIRFRIAGNKTKFYLAESKYATQVSKFIRRFGRERIFIETTEQLRMDPLHTLNRCFHFLGLSPIDTLNHVWENKTTSDSQFGISEVDRYWVREQLSSEVSSLRDLTGLKLSEWEDDFPLKTSKRQPSQII